MCQLEIVRIIFAKMYTFGGRYSTLQTKTNGITPADDKRITSDRDVTGIQSKADKLKPLIRR